MYVRVFLDELVMDSWCMLKDVHDDMLNFHFWEFCSWCSWCCYCSCWTREEEDDERLGHTFDLLKTLFCALHVFVHICTCTGPRICLHGVLICSHSFDHARSALTMTCRLMKRRVSSFGASIFKLCLGSILGCSNIQLLHSFFSFAICIAPHHFFYFFSIFQISY